MYTTYSAQYGRFQIISEPLVVGQNVEYATDTKIEVRIIDLITKSKRVFEIPLYVLHWPTYNKYNVTGVIAEYDEDILNSVISDNDIDFVDGATREVPKFDSILDSEDA